MATLKLTIFKAKVLKDGSHKIRVAVCHKQETCYIVTQFKIDNISQFKNGQVIKRPDASIMNTKLRHLLNEYQDRLDKIDNVSLYSSSQLKKLLLRGSSKQAVETFQSACDDYIAELLHNGQKGYAGLLSSSKATFFEYTNGDILLLDITPELIENYSSFLQRKKWSKATIGIAMRNVRTIINRSIKKRKVVYDIYPFIDYSIPNFPVRDVSIELESLKKIISFNTTTRKLIVVCDVFSLSFYFGGINLIDLLNVDFSSGGCIEYKREKIRNRTNDENSIVIPVNQQAKDIIEKWIDKRTGKLDFGYKFAYKNFSRYVSRSIKEISSELGIKERVVCIIPPAKPLPNSLLNSESRTE